MPAKWILFKIRSSECPPPTVDWGIPQSSPKTLLPLELDNVMEAKIWLFATDNLQTMYNKGGQISLWRDGRLASENAEEVWSKIKDFEGSTRRQEKEEAVKSVYKELRKKHGKIPFRSHGIKNWLHSLSDLLCSKAIE
jgi:hypothetical protein